jgi:hypothetical protein
MRFTRKPTCPALAECRVTPKPAFPLGLHVPLLATEETENSGESELPALFSRESCGLFAAHWDSLYVTSSSCTAAWAFGGLHEAESPVGILCPPGTLSSVLE